MRIKRPNIRTTTQTMLDGFILILLSVICFLVALAALIVIVRLVVSP